MIGNTTQLTFITDPDFAESMDPVDANCPRQVCAPRNALPETTLYVPLQFWFCTQPRSCSSFDRPSIPRGQDQP